MGTVLVADDSKTIRQICEWVFKGSEHQVISVTAGDEALHALSTHNPDVLILDYTLPDQDSYELCRSIKSNGGSVAVLMLGGTYAEFDEAKAAACGADDTLLKPFRADDLAEKVAELTALAAQGAVARVGGAPASAPEPAPAEATPANPQAPVGEPVQQAQPPAPQSGGGTPRFQFPTRSGGGNKRFSFPNKNAPQQQQQAAPPAPASRPAAEVTPTPAPAPRAAAPASTPAPAAALASVDPDTLRAEIQAAVKAELPGIVKGILRELITKEVTPQLQRWVQERVDGVAQRMLEERMR